MGFAGKVAVITGAGRGLGRGYALHLAKLGADIVVVDINLDSAREFGEELTAPTVVDEIRSLGRRSLGIQADVRIKREAGKIAQESLAQFGHIDILVNNAGGLLDHPENSYASTMAEEDLKSTLDRNLLGTIYCCQAVSLSMKERRSGKIVNIASFRGLRAAAKGWYASYGVAKAGIIHYTRYLASELGPYGINVNCISPGFVHTKRLAGRQEARKDQILKRIPLGRWAEPEDIAKVVEFFCSDLSDYVTGQCLSVCGGLVNY